MNSITARQNYKNLIERYFGVSACSFDVTSSKSNNVIGALLHKDYINFTRNFTARLERLSLACVKNPSLREPILKALNDLADFYNWDVPNFSCFCFEVWFVSYH